MYKKCTKSVGQRDTKTSNSVENLNVFFWYLNQKSMTHKDATSARIRGAREKGSRNKPVWRLQILRRSWAFSRKTRKKTVAQKEKMYAG